MTFHYFAGLQAAESWFAPDSHLLTISATHKLTFDCEQWTDEGVGTGLLDGNAVHEAFVRSYPAKIGLRIIRS